MHAIESIMSGPARVASRRLGGVILLLLAGTACSGSSAHAAPPAPPLPAAAGVAPDSLLRQIQEAIGDAACDSASQCRTVAIGSKACGGPERYLAWSSARTDGARLAGLVSQYAAARRLDDEKSGLMSTCEQVIDPGATCRQQRCALLPRGPGAGGAPLM